VVKHAWQLEQAGGFHLETVSLADKAGLDEAFARAIKTIPTVVLLDGDREVARIVGTPEPGELEKRLLENTT
jgi:hypothetical protein